MDSKINSTTEVIDLTKIDEEPSVKKEIKVEDYEFCTCMESIAISVEKSTLAVVSSTMPDNGGSQSHEDDIQRKQHVIEAHGDTSHTDDKSNLKAK